MLDKSVRLDYSFSLAEIIGEGGIPLSSLKAMDEEFKRVHNRLEQQWHDKVLGFWDLPRQTEAQLAPIDNLVKKLENHVDNLVVLGIGGSALGATAIDMALSGIYRQSLPMTADRIKIWVADNSDPRMFHTLLNRLDLERTTFAVISKSGGTAETMSQFMVVLDRLSLRLGRDKALDRIIFITDPKEGVLRQLACREYYTCLEVPSNVGGRFSVLSAVGLLPLALAGHDIRAILAGAEAMSMRCLMPGLEENPAYLFAALTMAFYRRKHNILVMMPYVSDLLGVAQWFAQLWGESLGKSQDLDGNIINSGQTPVAAIGATDQHSQLQLYMEGPKDKLICFLTLDNYGRDMEIPKVYQDIPSISYLGGRSMSELIQAEAKATAVALALGGRPSLSLRLPSLNEYTLGQLLFLLQAATVAAGALLNIDPLNQPGVELSKKLTYGIMGRPGFEEFKETLAKKELKEPYII
jgi:glucose-6-phosphate isomerase